MVVKRFLFLLVVTSCFIFNTSTVEAEEEIQSQIRSDIESPSPNIPSASLIKTQRIFTSLDSSETTSENKDLEDFQASPQKETNLNSTDIPSPNTSNSDKIEDFSNKNTQRENLQEISEADKNPPNSSILRDNINIEREVSTREEASRTPNTTSTKPKRVLTNLSSTIQISQSHIAIPYPKITIKPRRISKKFRELTDLYQALTISKNYRNIMDEGNEEEQEEVEEEQEEEQEEEETEEEDENEEEQQIEDDESIEEESTEEEIENQEYGEEIPQNAYMTQMPYNANGFGMSPINYTAPVINAQQPQIIQQPIIRNEEEDNYERQSQKRNYEVDNSERDELNQQLVDSQRKMATRLSELHQANLNQDQQMKNLQRQIERLQSHISSQEFSGERVSSESINTNHEREIVKDTLRYCMDNGLIREEDLDKINFENKVLGFCINCKSKKWITKLPNLGDKDIGVCDACSNILCTNAANGNLAEVQALSQSPIIENTYGNIGGSPYTSEYIQGEMQPYYSSSNAENSFTNNFVNSMNGTNSQSNYLEESNSYGEMRPGGSYSSEGSSSGGLSGMMGGIFGTVLNKAMNSVANGNNDNNSNQNSQTQNAASSNQLVMDANGNLLPMYSLAGTAAPYGYVRNTQGMLVPATTPQEAAAGAATAAANIGGAYNNTMYANQMVMDANGNLVPMSSLAGTVAPYGYVRNAQGMLVPASSPQEAATATNMANSYNNGMNINGGYNNAMYANQMVMDANGNLVPMSSLAGTAAPYGYVRNAQGMFVPASSPQEASAAANATNQSVLSKITQGASAVSNLAQNSGLVSGISNLTSSISEKIAAKKQANAEKAAEKKAAKEAKKAEKEKSSKKQNPTSDSSQNNNSSSQNNTNSQEQNNNDNQSPSDNGAQELAADQAQAKITDLDRKINNVKTKVLPGMESKLKKLQTKLEKMKTNLSKAKNEGAKQRAQAALDNAQKSVDEQQEKINKFNEDIKQWEAEKQEAEQKLKENTSATTTSAAASAA